MDLKQLTEEVKALALEAGAFLSHERKSFQIDKVEKKAAHDYVSYVDKESEKLIVKRLKELLPQAGFITEEGTGIQRGEELCWVVDPLDGTTNFIHNNAPYCVSIALRNTQEMLLGVVYECCRNEMFWAYKGSKAYLNDTEIHVSSVNELDDSFIELGFPYNAEKFRPFVLSLIEQLYGHVAGLRLMGSAASELCYIAAGRFEARVEGLLGPWDIAAGALILQQAGGKITDFTGGENYFSGKQVLATNGKIHKEMLKMILPLKFS